MTQAALEAGRTLDALVDEKLFGREVVWAQWGGSDQAFRKGESDFGMPMSVPYYSTKIADAFLLVDLMRDDWFSFKAFQPAKEAPELIRSPYEYANVSFICGAGPCSRHNTDFHNHHGAYNVEAETLPLAICRAALIAKRLMRDPEHETQRGGD